MKLFNGNMLELTHEGKRTIFYVVKQTKGKIYLAEHHEADVDARSRNSEDAFEYTCKSPDALRKADARPLHVDPLGRVHRLEVPNNAAADRGDKR